MIRYILYLLLFFVVLCAATCRNKTSNTSGDTLTVAFYNLDNLYDDIDDVDHDDQEFTPSGHYEWTSERYQQKLENMAKVISQLVDGQAPDVLGVCELESAKALTDLINTGNLKNRYSLVHYDSPDERGIDVALIYNSNKFKLISSAKIPVVLSKNLKDKTRDQLFVKTLVLATNDTLCFYVCHFPSRREGKDESEINRFDAAITAKKFINAHLNLATANLIVMGDFNDEPWDKSILEGLQALNINQKSDATLLNLMWDFKSNGRGSYNYKGQMNCLDQLIISRPLIDGEQLKYKSKSVNILDANWLTQTGKYEGFPLRTFGGSKWLNGYSDHYPVYLQIQIQTNRNK
ncbi:MAG: endonuclease/exonuclease/phosphatase family protein [bacterium]|nr:endonuclease/exonuclease/phosphatase family protein [bacterium]